MPSMATQELEEFLRRCEVLGEKDADTLDAVPTPTKNAILAHAELQGSTYMKRHFEWLFVQSPCAPIVRTACHVVLGGMEGEVDRAEKRRKTKGAEATTPALTNGKKTPSPVAAVAGNGR